MSAFTLARWFDLPRFANRPEDDEVREEVLNDLDAPLAVAVASDGSMIVRTRIGACSVEHRWVMDCSIVVFDHVQNDRWCRTRFWMNTSSVTDLLSRLLAAPRADEDALFVCG